MILGCPQCGTRFRLDDAKVKASGVKVRCSRCAHVFVAKPADGLTEPVPIAAEGDTRTRRVDAAAMIAHALETSQAPSADLSQLPEHAFPTGELSVAADVDDTEGLFASGPTASVRPPELDDLEQMFGAQGGDPFDQLDAASEAPSPTMPSQPGILATAPPSSSLSSGGSLSLPPSGPETATGAPAREVVDGALSQLSGPSLDLPAMAPQTSSFLDPGTDHPSRDLGFMDAMESDFLGGSQVAAATPAAVVATAPSESSFGITPRHTDRPEIASEMDLFAPTSGRAPGRIELANGPEEHTRISESEAPEPVMRTRSFSRRTIARWPTWLGLALGLVTSATFVPGWAPAPLDQIAPAVRDLLHPAARPRLENALVDVRSENASAFPYQVDEEVVVVVRGDAVHVGSEPRKNVYVNVLMLDGLEEVGRGRSPVGDAPDPLELQRRIALGSKAEAPAASLAPGERKPFLLMFRKPSKDVTRYRFRVEFTSGGAERRPPG